MITLYHGPKSCSVAVKMVLEIARASYNTEIVDIMSGAQFDDAYLTLNPLGKVPAVNIDGKVLTESGAILITLSEMFPAAELMPKEGGAGHALVLKWLFMMYTAVHPVYARVFMPERYGDNPELIKSKAEEELHKMFAIIDEQLSRTDYITDHVPYLPDYYLITCIHWEFILSTGLTNTYPNIARYKQRMLQIPEVKAVLNAEFG